MPKSGVFLRSDAVESSRHHTDLFDVDALFDVPTSPQGRPVIVQAGDSADGRDFATEHADVIFSLHTEFEDAQEFYRDVKGRLPGGGPRRGRPEDPPRGDLRPRRHRSRKPASARARSPSPRCGPRRPSPTSSRSGTATSAATTRMARSPMSSPTPVPSPRRASRIATRRCAAGSRSSARWRMPRSSASGISSSGSPPTTRSSGRPSTSPSEIDRYVQERATDGFTVVGHLTPHGLDEFTDRVIPLLQERGSYRTSYEEGATLRDLLDLPSVAQPRAGERMTAAPAPSRASAPIRLVTVGGGPRAAMLLERLLAHLEGSSTARGHHGRRPASARAGSHLARAISPPLLKLNSMAQDVTVFTDDTCTIDGPVRPGPSLIEWAELVRSGILTDVDIPDAGVWDELRSLRGDSFPTRRLQSCYLDWFWRTTVGCGTRIGLVRWREDTVTVRPRATATGTRSLSRAATTCTPTSWSTPSGTTARRPAEADPDAHRRSRAPRPHLRPPAFTADADHSAIAPGEDAIIRGLGPRRGRPHRPADRRPGRPLRAERGRHARLSAVRRRAAPAPRLAPRRPLPVEGVVGPPGSAAGAGGAHEGRHRRPARAAGSRSTSTPTSGPSSLESSSGRTIGSSSRATPSACAARGRSSAAC